MTLQHSCWQVVNCQWYSALYITCFFIRIQGIEATVWTPSADLEVLQDTHKPTLTGPFIRQVYIKHNIRPEEYMKEIITQWQFHDQDRLWQGRCGKGHKASCQVCVAWAILNRSRLYMYNIIISMQKEFELSDGEVMERLWSHMRYFSGMTKEMRLAHRIDVLTDALM